MELISQNQPKFRQIQIKVANLWQSFSTAEKLYSTALLLLIMPFASLKLAALCTLAGLTIEFWPRFVKAWDSLGGKAFILLFYATITNFALAFSAGIVNEVTGVSATHFNYTHNFALLLILPILAVGISLAALLVFQLIMSFYLFLLLVLKPFGIKLIRLFSKSEHPLFTNTIRFIAGFAVLLQFLFSSGIGEQIDKALASMDTEQAAQISDDAKESTIKQFTFGIQNESEDNSNLGVVTINTDTGNNSIVKGLVAAFAYQFEADIYSRCESPADTRSIELNDYEVLHIREKEDEKFGYQFTVAKCVSPAFPAAEG